MKRLRVFLVVLASCAAALAADAAPVTITDYKLEVRLIPDASAFDARGTIRVRNDTEIPQSKILLQVSSSLAWTSLHVVDRTLAFDQHKVNSEVDHTGALTQADITLASPLTPREQATIDVSYGGEIRRDIGRLRRLGAPAALAEQNEWDEIDPEFTGVRGIGYVAWYPVSLGNPAGAGGTSAASEWKLRTAESHMTVSFGGVDSPVWTNTACPKNTCEWKRLGFSVPTFVVGQRVELARPTVRVAYSPLHRAAAEQFALREEQVADFIADWIGRKPSPVTVIDLGDGDLSDFDAGDALFTSLSMAPAASGSAGRGLAPEIADAAMPVLLARSAIDTRRLWIDEGLAQFARVLWLEKTAGHDAAAAYMGNIGRAVAQAEAESKGTQPLIRSTDPAFFSLKAMFVWEMLREMVGDDALQRAIRAYRPGDDKEPSYVQRLVQREARGRDLEWFFDDWVYRDRGLPEFHIESAFPRPLLSREGETAGYTVTVTVKNNGDCGARVPVLVRTASGEVSEPVEVRAHATNVVRLTTPVEPVAVIVNDGSVPERDTTNNRFAIPTGTPK